MASEAQIRANRENAQRSTGPRTEAGRQSSRLNSLKHGLAAKMLVLSDADVMVWLHRQAWLRPAESLAAWWQPVIRGYAR